MPDAGAASVSLSMVWCVDIGCGCDKGRGYFLFSYMVVVFSRVFDCVLLTLKNASKLSL